jgi:hypothetical protein
MHFLIFLAIVAVLLIHPVGRYVLLVGVIGFGVLFYYVFYVQLFPAQQARWEAQMHPCHSAQELAEDEAFFARYGGHRTVPSQGWQHETCMNERPQVALAAPAAAPSLPPMHPCKSRRELSEDDASEDAGIARSATDWQHMSCLNKRPAKAPASPAGSVEDMPWDPGSPELGAPSAASQRLLHRLHKAQGVPG